jgi:hypothetical protein
VVSQSRKCKLRQECSALTLHEPILHLCDLETVCVTTRVRRLTIRAFSRFPVEYTNVSNTTLSLMRAAAVARERNGEQAKLSLLNVQFGLESLAAWLEGSSVKPCSHAVSAESTRVREKWRSAIAKVASFPF